MKRKLALLTIILVCVALLAGCGERITSGIVLEKEYTPRKTQLRMIPIVGGKFVSTRSRIITVPAKFRILVQGETESGETLTEWWNVDEAQYSAVKIGEGVSRETMLLLSH